MLVGNAARATLLESPGNAVYSAKRLMGRGVQDVQEELKLFPFHLAGAPASREDEEGSADVIRLQIGSRTLTPPEVSAYVLQQLKRTRSASSVGR